MRTPRDPAAPLAPARAIVRGQPGITPRRVPLWRAAATAAFLGLALVVSGCVPTTPPQATATPVATPTATPSAPATTPTPAATPSATAKPTGYAINVYFSKHADDRPDAVYPVQRISPDLGVAAFAISQLIAGPTAAERATGYYTPLQGALIGTSMCGGRDFTLTLDTHATVPETGTATLQFCRAVLLGGDLAGGRVRAEVTQTLLQFPTIKQVVILDYKGGCFDDLSGLNRCVAGYGVRVYFSKHPDSDTLPRAVFPVARTSPDLGVGTYAITQLIAGPTATERAAGYFSPLTGALSGTSTCGGADFKLTLDRNGTVAQPGTATLQFCRTVAGLGDTPAIMVRNEITSTLRQFSNIQKVVILYKDGSCFDDLIGCG